MPREFKINPKYMCDVHLKGEHYELHVFVGLLKLRRQVSEYVKGNMLEISTLKERHDELVRELQTRFKNFNHDSPLEVPDVSYLPKEIINHKIDSKANLKFLVKKCKKCLEKYVETKLKT